MASILQAEGISKSYGQKVLFDNIRLNINEGDKIALIAPNGTGKSTLLKVLAGEERSDRDGWVKLSEGSRVAWLDQNPKLDINKSIYREIFDSHTLGSEAVYEYETALKSDDKLRIERAIHNMDLYEGWQLDNRVKQVVSSLSLPNPDRLISTLSGGEKKRVALASVIINEADLIVLDEPTNHLDIESIEFLEEYLIKRNSSILMVTHDRYFLDRVCNQIIELDNGELYAYKGNYSYFLEKKGEREEMESTDRIRAQNLLRTELEWMRRMPKARGTKAKYRVDAFYELEKRAQNKNDQKQIRIDVKSSRLGTKVINCKGLTHHWGEYCTVNNFTYNFAKGEKIGIVGANGAGKSTFLNLITGEIESYQGDIEWGETLVIGHYKQEGLSFEENDTVIDAVRRLAETVVMSDGSVITTAQFLTRFLFPHSTHNTKIERLSGGEKRRLYLVTVLMQNPNFLILDEPTNDLDIMSLNVLEEYLASFPGTLIIVSHDRYFLDKLAQHLFIFEGNGVIDGFTGNYSEYRELEIEERKERAANQSKDPISKRRKTPDSDTGERTLTWRERKELEEIEQKLSTLEAEKGKIESALSSGSLSVEEITQKSIRIGELLNQIDLLSNRWLELNL